MGITGRFTFGRFAPALTILVMGSVSCSKNQNKVSNAQAVVDSVQAQISFTGGDNQGGVRRQTLPEAFVASVVNESAQPYGNAGLVLCLMDVTGIARESLDKKALFEACEAGQTSISQVPYDDAVAGTDAPKVRQQAEDLVGRPLEWTGISNDGGQATFKMVTPNKANRVIATVIYLNEKRGPETMAIATFSTAMFGEGEHFVVDSTNHNSEAAGANFNLAVLVEDADGYVVQSFNGNAEVELTYEGQPSWTGKESRMPKGRFACAFVQGRCEIPGGPWAIAPAGKTTLSLKEYMLNGPAIAIPFEVRVNAPSAVVVASKAGGPKAGAVPLAETELDLEQELEVAAAIIDDGGNYLGDSATAQWTVTDPALADTLPIGAKSTFIFYSAKSGAGQLSAVEQTIPRSIPLSLKVRSGVQDSWVITTEHHQAESAGQCFDLEVRAADVNGNTVFDVDGAVELTLRMEGITESGPAVADVAHFVSQGRNFDRIANITALFTKGVAHLTTQACLYDATAVSPVISVANAVGSQSIEGRVNVQVVPGTPSQLVLSSKPFGQNGVNYCAPGQDTIEKPCMAFTADESGSPAYVMVADKGGNALSATESTWLATGPAATSIDHQTFSAGSFATLALSTPGKGRIDISNPNGLKLSHYYEIKHGAPAIYQVSSQHNNIESSDTSFAIKVQAFDQYNNPCTGFDGTRAAVLSLADALPSPAPKFHQPQVSVIEPLVFSSGAAMSSGKMSAVYASSQPGVTAPKKPYIRATIDGHTFDSPKITVNAAEKSYTSLMTNAGGQGLVIKAPLFLHVNSAFTVYVAGYDVHGNYAGDEFSTFTVTGALTDSPANLSNGSGTTAVLVPSATGVATFTATPTTPGLQTLVINPINVTSSTAENLVIETTNNGSEAAGVPFNIKIRARDRQLNVAASYEGQKTLNFVSTSSTSWAGTASTLPSGPTLCTFVAGECTLSTNSIPTDFVITDGNSSHTTVITVRDQSNEIAGSYATTVEAIVGPAARVVVADKAGGPDAGAQVLYANRTITADQSLTLAAAVTDAAGNYISDASATWAGSSPEIHAGLSALSGTTVTFNAGAVGSGMLQASLASMTDGSTGTITVVPGTHSSVRLEAGINLVVTAGEAFPFTLKIIDGDGNVCTSINQAILTHMVWENSSSMPKPGAGDGIFLDDYDWQTWSQISAETNPAPRKSNTVSLLSVVDGVFTTPTSMKAQLFDATNTAPKLHIVMYPVGAFAGLDARSNALTVVPGPATHISFTTGPSPGSPSFCNRMLSSGGSGFQPTPEADKPWLIYPFVHGSSESAGWRTSLSDGKKLELAAPCYAVQAGAAPVTIYAEARDDGENFVSTATGSWSFVDYVSSSENGVAQNLAGMQADLSRTTGSSTTFTPRIATMSGWSSPQLNGVLLKFASISPPSLLGLAPVAVMGGPAVNFIQEPVAVYVDAPAYIQARLIDAYGNPGYLTGQSPTYAWNGTPASPSPKGTNPVLFSTGASYDGLYSPEAGKYFGFRSPAGQFPRAGESFVVDVTVGSMGTKPFTITTSAGDGVAFKVLNAPTPLGTPIPANSTFSIDTPPVFYGSLWDIEQNYVGQWRANFTVGGAFIGNTTSTSYAFQLAFSPPTVGSGVITATPSPASATGRLAVNPLSAVNLGNVTLTLGKLDHFQVVTEHAGSEIAGAPFDITIRAKDAQNNTLTTYNGTLALTITVTPGGANAEGQGQVIDGNGAFPIINNYTFTNGELVLPATFKNSLSAQTIIVTSGATTGQTTATTIAAGALDHYGVKLPQTSYSPRADRGTSFSAIVEPRDAFGNLIGAGEAGVVLTLVKSDGSAAVGTFSGTGTGGGGLDLSSGWVQVNDLAWDAAGSYRVKATKSGGKTTPVGPGSVASQILVADATLATVDRYSVTLGNANQTAGGSFTLTVKAVDKSGTKISTIDNLLTPVNYTWTGAGTAPGGQAPTIATPGPLSWSGGQALLDTTLFKAETIAIGQLQVVDDAPTPKSGVSTVAITVVPGALSTYAITTSHASRLADAASTFALTISPKDVYGNPRTGEAGVDLLPVQVGADPATVGPLHGATMGLNLTGSTSTTISNVYYRVPHLTKFVISGTSAASTSDQMAFTAVPATIDSYGIAGPGSVTAGPNNVALTVTARDEGGNALTTLDAQLNGYTFTWSGATDAPTQARSYGALSAFNAGVATVTHSLYKGESISLALQDDFGAPNRTGALALVVAPKPASKLELSTNSTSVVAGVPFDVTVQAIDPYGNLDTNFSSTDLKFQWLNANASLANVTSPAVLPAGTRTFSGGVFQSSSVAANAFALYNAHDTNVALKLVTPPVTTANLAFNVSPAAKAALKIQTGPLYTSSALTGTVHVTSTDSAYTYYTHSYDAYGNWIAAENSDWSNTGTWVLCWPGPTCNNFTYTPRADTSSTVFTPFHQGSADLTATSRATPALSKTITIAVASGSPSQYFAYISGQPSNLVAGQTFAIDIFAVDAKGNQVTSYTGSHNLSYSILNAQASPAPSMTPPDLPDDGPVNFSGGFATVTGFRVYRAPSAPLQIRVQGDLADGLTPAINTAPGSAYAYRLSGATNRVAGTPFNMTVSAFDQWDNDATGYNATVSLSFAWQNSNATYQGGLQPAKPTSYSCTFVAGVCTTTGTPFTLYKIDDSATLTMTGGLGLEAGFTTYPVSGAFTVTPASPITYVKIKDSAATPTLYGAAQTTTSFTTDGSRTFAVHAYDAYGNWVSSPSVTWSGTGAYASMVAPVTGSSATLTPALVGSGTVRADLASPSLSTQTGSISVTPGVLSTFTVQLKDNGGSPLASPVTAGTAFKALVTAYDAHANVTNVGSPYVIRFTLNGTTTGPAPDNRVATYGATCESTNTSHAFDASGNYLTNACFTLFNKLDASVTLSVTDGTHSGTSSAVSVQSASVTKLYATTATTSVTAGTGFDVTVKAMDAYSNTVASNNSALTFSWAAGNAVTGGSVPIAPTGQSLASGVYTSTGGAFKLFKMTGAPYDGTVTLTVSGGGLTNSTISPFTVAAAAAKETVVIHNTSSSLTLPGSSLPASSYTANLLPQFWLHSYDVYGNWKSLEAADWTAGAYFTGRLGTASGVNTVVFTPPSPGLGSDTLTATATGVVTNPVATASFSVTAGPVANYLVTLLDGSDAPLGSTVAAGTPFKVKLVARDSRNNPASGFPGNSSSLTWSWPGALTSPTPVAKARDLGITNGVKTFDAASSWTSGAVLALYSSTTTNAILSVTDAGSKTGSSSAITSVTPGNATNLGVTAGTATAGTTMSGVTVLLRDDWSNPTNGGCAGQTLTIACTSNGACDSPGGYGGSVTPPSFGGPYSIGAVGTYTPSAITLYKAGLSNLTFSACSLSASTNITTNPSSTVNEVYHSLTNAVPADGADLTAATCTSGTTVTCPTLYAFAFDPYGNDVAAGGNNWSCPAWFWADANSAPFNVSPYNATSLAASGHASGAISQTRHITGSVQCKVGGTPKSSTTMGLTPVQNRSYGWSCGNWSCSGSVPVATCTVTNNSLYSTSAYTFGGNTGGTTLTTTACDSGVSGIGTNSCTVAVSGVTGNASGALTVSATIAPSQSTFASLANPAAASVQGGAVAPTCP